MDCDTDLSDRMISVAEPKVPQIRSGEASSPPSPPQPARLPSRGDPIAAIAPAKKVRRVIDGEESVVNVVASGCFESLLYGGFMELSLWVALINVLLRKPFCEEQFVEWDTYVLNKVEGRSASQSTEL